MIAIISPAKKLNETTAPLGVEGQSPYFLPQAEQIMRTLARKSESSLQKLQNISLELARENVERNRNWSAAGHEVSGQPAALTFAGDVYQGLNATQWQVADFAYADEHLRILSGLYGVLKPSDRILPYRLEMGTRLKIGKAPNLYKFWAESLSAYFAQSPEEVLINLASQEYFKAVDKAKLSQRVLDVSFKDQRGGSYRTLSFFAKKARGRMADFLIRNRLNQPEDLRHFDLDGYYFSAPHSSADHYVFLRDENT